MVRRGGERKKGGNILTQKRVIILPLRPEPKPAQPAGVEPLGPPWRRCFSERFEGFVVRQMRRWLVCSEPVTPVVCLMVVVLSDIEAAQLLSARSPDHSVRDYTHTDTHAQTRTSFTILVKAYILFISIPLYHPKTLPKSHRSKQKKTAIRPFLINLTLKMKHCTRHSCAGAPTQTGQFNVPDCIYC